MPMKICLPVAQAEMLMDEQNRGEFSSGVCVSVTLISHYQTSVIAVHYAIMLHDCAVF